MQQVSDTSPFSAASFCNDLMKELESNPATRIVWNSVKPMLMGRILYAPDSPAVSQIIRNVSGTQNYNRGVFVIKLYAIKVKKILRSSG